MKDELDKYQEDCRVAMEKYSKEIRDYLKVYGNDDSDYLTSRRETCSYYRGKYNATIELRKMIGTKQ